MKPDPGSLVFYQPLGIKVEAPRPAFIAERIDDNTAALCVLGVTGQPYGLPKVSYDAGGTAGRWRYPSDFGHIVA